MAYDFKDEDKQEINDSRIPFGVTKVHLLLAEAGETDAGKDYIEFTVTDKDGNEEAARVWFTGKAAPYSFNTCRSIVVHQGKDDKQKEEYRLMLEKCPNSEELAKYMNTVAQNGELWLVKTYDGTGRTYVDQQGTSRTSINKNVYGYEPTNVTIVDKDPLQEQLGQVQQAAPGAEPASPEASNGIPKGWD